LTSVRDSQARAAEQIRPTIYRRRRRCMRMVGHGGTDWVEALEDFRRFIPPENGPLALDIELYHALPDKLRGHVWAEYVD